MTNKELLISRINALSEEYILSLLDAVTLYGREKHSCCETGLSLLWFTRHYPVWT